jgi:hypothetical protein
MQAGATCVRKRRPKKWASATHAVLHSKNPRPSLPRPPLKNSKTSRHDRRLTSLFTGRPPLSSDPWQPCRPLQSWGSFSAWSSHRSRRAWGPWKAAVARLSGGPWWSLLSPWAIGFCLFGEERHGLVLLPPDGASHVCYVPHFIANDTRRLPARCTGQSPTCKNNHQRRAVCFRDSLLEALRPE